MARWLRCGAVLAGMLSMAVAPVVVLVSPAHAVSSVGATTGVPPDDGTTSIPDTTDPDTTDPDTTDPDTTDPDTTDGPEPTTGTTADDSAPTTVAGDDDERDAPSDWETVAALVAVLGAIALGAAVIWMVNRAHGFQADLARAALAQRISIGAASTPASAPGGPELAAADQQLTVSGPERLVVGESGVFSVDAGVTSPTWEVGGATSYSRRNPSPDRLELTVDEAADSGEVTVKAGGKVGKKKFTVVAAPRSPAFVMQLATRSWGLVVVATAVVFGAVALGLTGRLDGGNFVALVAPLAALLGVTTTGGGRGDRSGGG